MKNDALDPTTAAQHQLALCHACHCLNEYKNNLHAHCRRCGASLHLRKPHSLQRAWFYAAIAGCLLIPANMLPIMTILNFGRGEPSTIIGGVVLLMHYKIYGIALVIFIFSFLIPLSKLIALILLLLSTQFDLGLTATRRTKIYRIVEFCGRWSMLDIFVVALLVGLVHLGQIAHIVAEPGAIAFAAVVIVTMLAAQSFDPRLMWDNEYERKN